MAAWYLVPKFLETPSYKVAEKDGNIEVRYYESMLLQSVKVSGDQYRALRLGLPLVNIGAKLEKEKISMTAPVIRSSRTQITNGWCHFPCHQSIAKKLPEPNNKQVYSENKTNKGSCYVFWKTNRDGSLIKERKSTFRLEKETLR